MKQLIAAIIGHTGWLYVRIYENPLFFLDWWSFAHLWSGAVIYAVLLHRRVRRPWRALVALLCTYEVFEIVIPYLALNVFRPETIKDQFTDICVGGLGGWIVDRTLRFNASRSAGASTAAWNLDTQVAALVAMTIAFVWVGNYGYRYNVPGLNTQGLNYYVFAAWALGLFTVIQIYRSFSVRWTRQPSVIGTTWLAGMMILFTFEFVSYHILHVHEISKPARTALIFDMIHGTTALHWFYLTAPMTAIGAFNIARRFFAEIPIPTSRAHRQLCLSTRATASMPGSRPDAYASIVHGATTVGARDATAIGNRRTGGWQSGKSLHPVR